MTVTVYRDAPLPSTSSDLHNVIIDCLQHCHYLDALTLSELYYEKTKSQDGLSWICECLLRLGRLDELYGFLSLHSEALETPRLRYTFARCCFDLNKIEEALRTLVQGPYDASASSPSLANLGKMGVKLHPVLEGTASASFAGVLLSKILCETGVEDGARMHAGRSLQTNPFLWSALTQFLQTGGKDVAQLCGGTETTSSANAPPVIEQPAPRIEDVAKEDVPMEEGNDEDNSKITPVRTVPPQVGAVRHPAAPRKTRTGDVGELRRSTRQSVNYAADENVGSRRMKPVRGVPRLSLEKDAIPGRTSARICEIDPKTRASRSPTTKKHEVKQPLASRNANRSSSSHSMASSRLKRIDEKEVLKEKVVKEVELENRPPPPPPENSPIYKSILATMKALSCVEEAISLYDWARATQLLENLSTDVRQHVQCTLQKARTVFEMCDYQQAREILTNYRRTHAYRLEGLDLFSTCLWHLQRHFELSNLAQELTTKARDRAESWLVAGNCFSLNKSHQQAVECFRRSIMLNPHYAYAHSLLGHELIEMDEVEAASQSFRKAIAINPSDYRAWYGLGMVNHRREQNALAQRDLSKALSLNKTNVSLLCQLAVVEKALNKPEEALRLLKYALQLDPNRTVSKFHLAKLHYEMGDFDSCIMNLEELKVTNPDEAQIYFLLGKAYRRRNNTHLALLNFNWAAELDPRGEQTMNYMNEQPFDDDGSP